jgi:enoyl-[acyl-carrier protein] reductase II
VTEITRATRDGSLEQLLIFGGQSCGLIGDVAPAAEIVRSIVAEAEAVLRRAVDRLG